MNWQCFDSTRSVDCRTSHSLALASHGAAYKHKLGNPRALDAIEFLESVMKQAGKGRDKCFFALCALRRVSAFFGSEEINIDLKSVHDDGSIVNPSGETLDS
ncbi:hypothetical protein [Paucibacter sp. B51]|uniref:hypothetical protein n=1 Tax=Paucibacter sp. B51 TaxID=2993315 RepID=UPI0022EBAB44|nr:hypothetical protein [Paucibacter sp. B51]